MLQSLQGQWYLTYTNFAMWKHPQICNVTFNYTPIERDNRLCIFDEVKYAKQDEAKSIQGYDFEDAADPMKFVWQGKGWMFWIKCPWKIEWINEAQTCIVLSFEKTWLTAGGVDVVTREKLPKQQVIDEALEYISTNEYLRTNSQHSIRVLQK